MAILFLFLSNETFTRRNYDNHLITWYYTFVLYVAVFETFYIVCVEKFFFVFAKFSMLALGYLLKLFEVIEENFNIKRIKGISVHCQYESKKTIFLVCNINICKIICHHPYWIINLAICLTKLH